MRKIGLFLITFLLLVPIFINAEEILENNYFYKRDEQGNNISNAEFILRNADGKVTYDVTYSNNEKAYEYYSIIEDDYSKLINIVPSDVKDIITNFRKMEDFEPYNEVIDWRGTIPNFKKFSVNCEFYSNESSNLIDSNNYLVRNLNSSVKFASCQIGVPTVMFLEETKTPEGFEKETAVIPSTVSINYAFDIETEEISDVSASLNATSSYFSEFYKYDASLDYNNIESVYNAFYNYDDNMRYGTTGTCKPFKSIGGDTDSEEVCGRIIIVDKAGHSNLSIESFVNNEEEVNLTQSDNVQIKVFLKNQGSAPSYDNVVVSEVPKGVEYVEGSANANGIYNPEDRTVTWNLEYLDAHDGFIFAYDVAVTTGQSSNIYVTTSSVTSNENTTPVESNEARVTTPGMGSEDIPDNPKTGDTRNAILVFGLLISFGFLYYSFSKRSFKL